MHAKLGVGSGMWEVTTGCESCGMEGARLRCPWAVAGLGRASRRRAEPTTTRLHHYAGQHSHGSSTTVETFFAHAHPKWLIFDHFHRAGAVFLSQRHPERPPGATQGRSFFHVGPLEVAVASVECVDGASAPVGGVGARPSENSHAIRLGEASIKSENVAIPTI